MCGMSIIQNEYIEEAEFVREHNRVYGKILYNERKRRKIAQADLAYGILSRTALDKVEKGEAQWTKMIGDLLMQRMGILPDLFESLATGEELDRWRLREDICMLVPGFPREAGEKTEEYRRRFAKRESYEEQFLLKVQVILALSEDTARDPEEILKLAQEAVCCTVPMGWRAELDSFWLAPGELEAVLLESAALFMCGREAEGWEIWQSVWDYPKRRKWEEAAVFIVPQAAVMGMRLCIKKGDNKKAFELGKEALELLRHSRYHCYVLPLLEILGELPEEDCEREYLKQAGEFLRAFRMVYDLYGYPGHRIWQGICVNNTKEAGTVLWMLRTFYGKSVVNAVYDGKEQVITPRQLEKIERGMHKPSYENYRRLVKQYGKYGGWNIPILETESVEILKLRRRVNALMEFEDWEEAERELGRLREKVNPEYPRVRQELLFSDAVLKWAKEDALQESLDMMMEALHYTVPNVEDRDMGWWVFQRQEVMLASDIASLYRRLGCLEEAGRWIQALIFSVEKLSERTGICTGEYNMIMEGYDNYLGDLGQFEEAVEMNEKTILRVLRFPQICGMERIFYRIAWNAYEIADANKMPEGKNCFRQKWRKAFEISEVLAEYMYDSHLKEFLHKRRDKYLS